ncbi:MAG TPA: hypothetical protein VNW06_00410 [Cytophagaceae bacterium]|jgi:hypothetical protein|nr:hypothetical protein [Cytophagaceae bacterium]
MKNLSKFTKMLLLAGVTASLPLGLFSCKKKSSNEQVQVSQPYFQVGQPVSNAGPVHGSIKGTMLAGQEYDIDGDVTINHGDTLVIQPGAKLYFGDTPPGGNAISMIVRGNLLSLGNKDNPIYFTKKNQAKMDNPGQDPTTDPAYQGLWGGILGDTNTQKMIIKWTHIEFGCGKLTTSPVVGISNGGPAYMISFVNPNGIFVLEDSWMYGGVDDPMRIQGGKINIMRNTFEKGGFVGGESCNIKSGTVGNYAYNVTVGSATNGPKASNKGGKNPQTNIYMYNNTIVNSGYRRNAAGRGGSLNFEQGAAGKAYNNIVVNCKYGLRVLCSPLGNSTQYSNNPLPPADTANIRYGHNLYYVDSLAQANQIYPVEAGTIPQISDIPNFFTLGITIALPIVAYDGTAAIRATGTNPQFANWTLPSTTPLLQDIAYATGFNFHLNGGSPALGKGFTGFGPQQVVPIDANFGSSGITPPNVDLGAYPSDGTGNQH